MKLFDDQAGHSSASDDENESSDEEVGSFADFIAPEGDLSDGHYISAAEDDNDSLFDSTDDEKVAKRVAEASAKKGGATAKKRGRPPAVQNKDVRHLCLL